MRRPYLVVLLGAVLAAGSLVAAYVVWAHGVDGPAAVAAYAGLAVVGLVGAGLTLRDLRR